MLQTLHASQKFGLPVYGMNRGTVGFLMNPYQEDDLLARITAAEETTINPLRMQATDSVGLQELAFPIQSPINENHCGLLNRWICRHPWRCRHQ